MATAALDEPAAPPGFVDEPPVPDGFVDEPPAPEGFVDEKEASSPSLGQYTRLVPAAIAEASAQAIKGLVDLSSTPITPAGVGGFVSKILGGPSAQDELVKAEAESIRGRAGSTYGVEDATRKTLPGKIIQGAASLVPAIASGPAAPAAMAGMMGESLRSEAEVSGASPEQQEIARLSGVGIGGLSEALLGVPALLRSAKAYGVPESLFKAVVGQAAKSVVREGVQEGAEQAAQNLVASTIAGYDPERKTFANVPESMLIGGLVGGPSGAAVQTAASLDALSASPSNQLIASVDESANQLLSAQLEQGGGEQVAPSISPEPPPLASASEPMGAAGAVPAISPVTPETSTGTTPPTGSTIEAATAAGPVEGGTAQGEPTVFRNKAKPQYAIPYDQLDAPGKLARSMIDNNLAREFNPVAPAVSARVAELTAKAEALDTLRPGEAGGFGTGGGLIPTLGTTPSGSVPLRIPSAMRRAATGALFQEGSADLLAKLENPVAQELSTAIRKHVDEEQAQFAKASVPLEKAVQGMSARQQNKAFDELERHTRAKENGRPTPALSAAAKKILTAWEDVAELTGKEMDASGVMLFDPKLGGYRKPKLIGRGYVPRMFSGEVQAAFRDRTKNPELWNNLVRALATHKGITEDAAASELNATAGEFVSNDHFANIEMARSEQLPEIFYDYDLRNLIAAYVPRYAERVAQIKAYGQRLLGPGGVTIQPNLFDKARAETQDTYSQEYLNTLEQQATNQRAVGSLQRNMARGGALANALLLSSPTTTVPRNLLSGTAATGELFGVARGAEGLLDAAKPQSFADAREMGVIRSNMADMLFADQLGDSKLDNFIRGLQNITLKWSGYNGSELFVRTHGAMTASQYAQDAALQIATAPASGMAKEATKLFKRMGVDPAKIVAENGDWKTGVETQKFIRAAVRDTQGGYRFDQVPLWANSPAGRFFYQYGRYGVQRSRNIWKNGVLPALAGDPRALLRMGVSAVLLGEVFALLSKGLFDRDRKDASLKEIAKAWDEDKLYATALGMQRMVNDVINAGSLGIIGQPIDWAKSLKDRSRFKDPFAPPSLSGVKALTELSQDAMDQGGRVTNQDLWNAFGSAVPGVKQTVDVGRRLSGDELLQAQRDVQAIRGAAMRWAKQQGLDVAPKMRGDSAMRKSEKAPIFEPIKEALLVGDSAQAAQLAREYLLSIHGEKEREKAADSLRDSIKTSQPFRAGPYWSPKNLVKFDEWAKKNLPAPQYERSQRIQNRYMQAAQEAGLMD